MLDSNKRDRPFLHRNLWPRKDMRQLTQREQDSIHWLTMVLTLPESGIAEYFPTEESRLNRMIEVRWPQGPVCLRCAADHPTWMRGRHIFQCNSCRYQYSVTTGTVLHRSRLSLAAWFHTASALIRYHRDGWHVYHLPVLELASDLGTSYATAHRTRKIALMDVQRGGEGFLSQAICVGSLSLPENLVRDSEEHLLWLSKTARERFEAELLS